MLTPDYLTHVSEGAEAIAARLHTDVTKRITRRIVARQNRGDDYLLTSADKWQIETLMDAGYLREDIMKDIAAATGLQMSEIKEAFEDAGVKSTGYDDRVYKAAGLDPLPFKQSPYMQRLMQRNFEATAGLWQNYTGTLADAAQQTFINAMDDIYTKVASGSMSYIQAYQEAIDDLAANGVDLLAEKGQKYVLYKSGHRDTIETAALRCVRTGISQMSAQVTEARMDEMGVDLVIVSSHMGARPDHAVWQGGIYSRSGLDKKHPNFRESTGYGTGAGLCGWNCRHQFSPYFEGMDNPFPEIDEEENAEAYELTQQQRKMERTIRKTKRMAEVYADTAQAETDPAEKERYQNAADRARTLLKRQMEGYSAFCDKHDLRPLPERLRIARASRATGNTNLTKIDVTKADRSQNGNIREIPDMPRRPRRSNYSNGEEYSTAVDVYKAEREKIQALISGYASEDAGRTRTIKTLDDFRTWAKKYNIDISGIENSPVDARLYQEIAETEQEMFERYPIAKEYIEESGKWRIRFDDSHGVGDYLFEANGGLGIGKDWADYETALQSVYRSMSDGYLTKGDGTLKTVLRHEYGHNVDNAIRHRITMMHKMEGDNWRANFRTLEEYHAAERAYFDDLHRYSDELRGLLSSTGASEYATVNEAELFAEGFAEYTSGGKTEFGKLFGEFLERWLK